MAAPSDIPILSERERARLWDRLLLDRLDDVVPRIMERAEIDCWVLVAREYNEDPVVTTMLPSTWINARRRTMLVFNDFGRTRAEISRYGVGDALEAACYPVADPELCLRLSYYLEEVSPLGIGLSRCEFFPERVRDLSLDQPPPWPLPEACRVHEEAMNLRNCRRPWELDNHS